MTSRKTIRSDSLDGLATTVDDFVRERSWTKYHNPKDIAIALSVEASELLEIFQWKPSSKGVDADELARIKKECADVVIYALSMANACGFDLGEAIRNKISLNKRKYPAGISKDMFD